MNALCRSLDRYDDTRSDVDGVKVAGEQHPEVRVKELAQCSA